MSVVLESAVSQTEHKEKSGIDSVGKRIENVVADLEDLRTLVGEVKKEPVSLKNGVSLISGLGMNSEAKIIQTIGKDLRNGIFNVLVIGTFKNGKSTLLNALLKDEILMSKAGPATAIITKMKYGVDEMVTVKKADETEIKMTVPEFKDKFTLTVDDIDAICEGTDKGRDGVADRFKDFAFAQIESLHPLCNNGVQLIDSPGLEESSSRNRVTRTYFPEAHAIIFVLLAVPILSEKEKEFISKNISNKNINNIFFIVNKLDYLRTQADRVEVAQIVHKYLFPLFKDEELYNKRVFFVSALDALIARAEDPVNETLLNSSNLLAFERELEAYLTSEERVKAGFSATFETVNSVVETADKNIQGMLSSLDQPIEKLKKNREETEGKLVELEKGVQRKKEIISTYGTMISYKINSNLDFYIGKLLTNWDTDASQVINLSDIKTFTAVTSTISEKSRNKMTDVIERELNKYFKTKFEEWASSELPQVINPILKEMEEKLEQELKDFNLQLAEIEKIFSGKHITKEINQINNTKKATKMSQAIGGLILLDPSQVACSLMGDGSWSKFLGRFILDTVIAVICFSAFGPLAIVAYIIAEVLHTKHSSHDFRSRIISGIGTKLRVELPKQVKNKEPIITRKIEAKFNEIGEELTKSLQAKIEDVRKEQDRIISLIQRESSAVNQEKKRLTVIQENIKQVVEDIKCYV